MNTAEPIQTPATLHDCEVALKENRFFDAAQIIALVSPDEIIASAGSIKIFSRLIETGYYRVAADISSACLLSISCAHVAPELRSQLDAMRTFALFFVNGELTKCTDHLEELLNSERENNASSQSVALILSLLARTVALGASFRMLPEEDLLRARQLMGEAARVYKDAGCSEERLRALFYLAQMQCSGSYPDPTSAILMLKQVARESESSPLVKCDAERRMLELYLVDQKSPLSAAEIRASLKSLVDESADQVAKAFATLAMARALRSNGHECVRELEDSVLLFRNAGHLSGVYDGLSALAALEMERGHYARAGRLYREIEQTAGDSGFMQGLAVAKLGLFQVCMTCGETDRAKEIGRDLLGASQSELVSGSLGLSLTAAMQLLGDLERARKMARACYKVTRRRGMDQVAVQALYLEGSSLAGLNRWKEARGIFQRCVLIERETGNLIGEAEKLLVVAQAFVMEELTQEGIVSEVSMRRATRELEKARKIISSHGGKSDIERHRAKIYQTEAQLYLIARKPIDALKSLSLCRESFQAAGASRDVAFVDAQCGLALLELGKSQKPHMFEEAFDNFRRALEYFNSEKIVSVRWKLEYYLTLTSILISQTRGSESERVKWRISAHEWLELSKMHLQQLKEAGQVMNVDVDFSPALTGDALDKLAADLDGVQPEKPKTNSGFTVVRRRERVVH